MAPLKRPRKPPFARREGSPPYVLAVHQEPGPGKKDTYMVFFTWPLWQESMGPRLPYLEVDITRYADGGHWINTSWGEVTDRADRQGCGKLISWKDLPPELQGAVIRTANKPDEIVVVVPCWEAGPDGKMCWLLGAAHGYGYYGDTYPNLKACREACKSKGWVLIENDPASRREHSAFLKAHKDRYERFHGLGPYA